MIWVKVNGAWVESTPWVKLQNQWTKSIATAKVLGSWRPSTDVGLEVFPNPDPGGNSLKSSKYTVEIFDGGSYIDAHVYSATNMAWTIPAGTANLWASGSYPVISFLTFSIRNSSIAKVSKVGGSIASIDVGPYKKGKNANTEISNGVAYIPINKDEKLWVTINNEVSSPLFIFADSPFPTYSEATAAFPSYKHILTPTGINFVSSLTGTIAGTTVNSAEGYSNRLQLSSNTLVYVQRGSYIKGNFNISGCNNVKFMGQGVVSLENYDWWNNFVGQSDSVKSHGTVFYSTNPSTVNSYLDWDLSGNGLSGLTIIRTPYYFNGESSFQSIDNLKYISPWNYNTDGPRLGNRRFRTTGAKMLNSFIFNADDCSFPAVAQSHGNCLVSSCYLNSHHGGVFTNYFANFTYDTYAFSAIDIDVRCYAPYEGGKGAIFRLLSDYQATSLPSTDYRGPINLIFSGINVENTNFEVPIFRIGNLPYPYGTPNYVLGMTSGIEFSGLTASSTNVNVSANLVSGLNSTNKAKNITFTNLKINGTFVDNLNYDNYFDVTGATNKTTDNINFNTT